MSCSRWKTCSEEKLEVRNTLVAKHFKKFEDSLNKSSLIQTTITVQASNGEAGYSENFYKSHPYISIRVTFSEGSFHESTVFINFLGNYAAICRHIMKLKLLAEKSLNLYKEKSNLDKFSQTLVTHLISKSAGTLRSSLRFRD